MKMQMMLIDGTLFCQCGNGAIYTETKGWICTEHNATNEKGRN